MYKKIIFPALLIIACISIVGITYYFLKVKDLKADNVIILKNNSNNMNTTEGLTIEIVREGNGVGAVKGQTLLVDYTGSLTNGTVFDSSIPRGEPFMVRLGAGEVIRGWDLGLLGMKVGEERTLTIAPELGYGVSGFPGVIPPNATLIFNITLKAIQ